MPINSGSALILLKIFSDKKNNIWENNLTPSQIDENQMLFRGLVKLHLLNLSYSNVTNIINDYFAFVPYLSCSPPVML